MPCNNSRALGLLLVDWAGVSASASGKPKVAATYLETALRMNPSSPRTAALFDKVCEQTLSARPYYQLQIAEPMKVPKARHGPKPPTPEPEPEPEKPPPQAAGMPANWEHIDLSDIVYEQTLLRDAILMALDEGITSKEVTVIVNMMKRAGHKKSTIAHVDEALGNCRACSRQISLPGACLHIELGCSVVLASEHAALALHLPLTPVAFSTIPRLRVIRLAPCICNRRWGTGR